MSLNIFPAWICQYLVLFVLCRLTMWDEMDFRVREMLDSEYFPLSEIGETQALQATGKNKTQNMIWTILYCPQDGKANLSCCSLA